MSIGRMALMNCSIVIIVVASFDLLSSRKICTSIDSDDRGYLRKLAPSFIRGTLPR